MISLITVTYNSAETLRDTMQSIINQTFTDYEYIVVDGNSKDDTIVIIKEFEHRFCGRMRWISEPDKGIYDAMNKGIKIAKGDVVGILNSDDFFASENILYEVSKCFENQANLDAVYGDVRYVDWNDTSKTVRMFSGKDFTPKKLCWGQMPPHPSFYVKRKCYDNQGLYSLDYPICADYDMFVKMFWEGKINAQYVPEIFVNMRNGGTSSNGLAVHKKIMRERMRCIKEHKLPSNFLMQSSRYFFKVIDLIKK